MEILIFPVLKVWTCLYFLNVSAVASGHLLKHDVFHGNFRNNTICNLGYETKIPKLVADFKHVFFFEKF